MWSVPSKECPSDFKEGTDGIKELAAASEEGSYKFKAKKAGKVGALEWGAADSRRVTLPHTPNI